GVDLRHLPVEFNDVNSAGWLGPFIMLFAFVWGGGPTGFLVQNILNGTFEPGMLLVLFFTVLGAGLFIFGFVLTFHKERYRISSEEVCCTTQKFRRSEQWREPLANYQGVVMRSEYHKRSGRHGSSYTLYIVELRHPQHEKTVLLCQSRSDRSVRRIWEDSAKALRKTAMEYVDGKLHTREPEDLDKSVRDLMQEGKVKWEDVSLDVPPDGVRLGYDQGSYVFTVSHCNAPWPVMKVLGLIVAGLIALLTVTGIYFIAGLAALAVLWQIFWLYGVKTELKVNSQRIEKAFLYPWGKSGTAVLEAGRIEGIQFKSSADNRGGSRDKLVITTDQEGMVRISTGWITNETLEWLRSAMLKALSL
ncbi:MAG TPA: hypothetical protein P5246_07050, partial [Candidatus Omnitrophota bacterium]|nr:hypothetical protein [Candidatus Omnitrophota bacterium]